MRPRPDRARTRGSRGQLSFVLFCAVMLTLHAIVADPVLRAVIYVALGTAVVGAVVLGTQIRRGPLSRAWRWLAAGMILWVVGDALWYLADPIEGAPYPSVTDGLYLVGYVLLAAGPLALAFTGRSRRGCVTDLIDASIIALSGTLLVWSFVFQPTVDLGASAATFVSFAYSASDLVLLALLLALLFNPVKRSRPVSLLALALAAIFTADSLNYVAEFAPPVPSEPLNLIWLAGYALIGIAALDRSAVQKVVAAKRPRSPVLRLVTVGTALLAIPAAIAVDGLSEEANSHWLALVLLVTMIIALVVTRGVRLVRGLARSSAGAESARQSLATVVDTAGVGIVFRTGDLMTMSNLAFQEMLGYSAVELSEMNYLDVVHPDEREDARMIPVLPTGRKSRFGRRLIGKDGEIRYANITVTTSADGLSVAVIEDVTERRELERQLDESQKHEAIARLAGGIAHDFNNLLTGVSGHAELLRSGQTAAENEQSIDVILESTTKAATLTRKLLAFSRTSKAEPEVIDVPAIVRNAVGMLDRLLPSDIQVSTRIEAGAPAIFADPTEVDQLLFNLALNARDAMPNGGVLTFGVEPWRNVPGDTRFPGAAAGDYCLVTVGDTGVGMDEAISARIFEPYFTTKEFGKGTGLGLSIIYGIVTAMGGHISVESAPDSGSAFTIIFPAGSGATPGGVKLVAA